MNLRFRLALAGFTILFSLVIFRLFYWQVVKASELASLGEEQYGKVVKMASLRGEIETSDGFPIVSNKISYLVYANPKEVKNREKTANVIAKALKLESASISAQLSRNLFWVPLGSGVDSKIKEDLEEENLPGIGFQREFERFYPEASMAATLVGFVGKDDLGINKGYFGIEGHYDRLLRGKEESAVQIHDALGRPILARLSGDPDGEDGSSLTLGINRSIQFLVEKKLKEAVQRFGAMGGMVGIMDPKTGEIIAMANYPTFDPRDYQKYDEATYKNPFVSNLYEPGSTFKPLVMSAAFNEKVLSPTTRCPICSGPVTIGDYQLHTWNDKYYPNTTMIEVIQHSDNTGMVYAAQSLGLDKMLSYFKKFGIGRLTGIDLQGEVSPNIKPESQWYPVDLATAGFGQGISVTAIELLTAFSSIANKGIMMEPHMVTAVKNNKGKITKVKPKEIGRPISEVTSKVMSEILVNAVNKGEAQWTRLKGYRVAGKTGTASIPVEGHYDPEKTIASFMGFAPANDPKFVMIVVLDRPTTSVYGAETAAPVFFSIAKDLFMYYGIPPEE